MDSEVEIVSIQKHSIEEEEEKKNLYNCWICPLMHLTLPVNTLAA